MGMTRKEQTLEKFEALKQVLAQGKVPESLKPMVRSIQSKLEAEAQEYRSYFENSEGRIQTPSMGMIEMTSEKTGEPVYFFGSSVKSRDRIRIRVYQASLNPQTEEIFKENLISDSLMTEKQLADLISNPGRGSGYPATQLVSLGKKVAPYDPSKDTSKINMEDLKSSLGVESRIEIFQEESRELLEKAKETGRVTKSEGKDLARTLRSGATGMAGGARFKVGKIAETYAEHISEAQMTIHMDIRSEQAQIGLNKDED